MKSRFRRFSQKFSSKNIKRITHKYTPEEIKVLKQKLSSIELKKIKKKLSPKNWKGLSEKLTPEELKIVSEKLTPDELGKFSRKHLERLSKYEKFFYERPIFKVPLFVGLALFLRFIINVTFPKGSHWESDLAFLVMLLLSIYLISFMIYVIRHSFKSLLSATNIWTLFFSYITFIFCILMLMSSAYASSERLGKGYLTYGQCSDKFDTSMIQNDPSVSHDYFYFSSITLFTVGYGDICPMGWSKGIALFNAFIGNFISVVVMVIVISAYLKRKGK